MKNYLTINRVSELSRRFHTDTSVRSSRLGSSVQVSHIDPQFSDTESEPQTFQPSEMMATLIGAA